MSLCMTIEGIPILQLCCWE